MSSVPDEGAVTADAEVAQTLERYRITVSAAELPQVAEARDFMRGLADKVAEVPGIHATGPAVTFGFPAEERAN